MAHSEAGAVLSVSLTLDFCILLAIPRGTLLFTLFSEGLETGRHQRSEIPTLSDTQGSNLAVIPYTVHVILCKYGKTIQVQRSWHSQTHTHSHFMGNYPNVDDREFYFLILIFAVISDLEMCIFSSAGILTGEQTLTNYCYVLILI